MEKTMGVTEVIRTLYSAASKSHRSLDADENIDFYFASANIHLNALMSLATSCEISAESEKMTPEIRDLMRRFSESLHLIAFGLDDSIGQIAIENDYDGWSPIYNFEQELKEAYKKVGTKIAPV